MSETTPFTVPRTDHVLRPHHVDLLTIIVLTFKEFESRNLPQAFLLHLYRLLLNEISQVRPPKTRPELLAELCAFPKSDDAESKSFILAFKGVFNNLSTVEQMNNFFASLPALFVDKADEVPPTLMRRSLFGFFCRRCFLSFLKLSFSGVVKLQEDYQAWCRGDLAAGYDFVEKDQLDTSSRFVFRTTIDHKRYARPDPFEAWEMASMTGDQNAAVENLRQFFEQQFHDNNDSGIRQHALLNLVRMHYKNGEFTAARQLLSEAINTSRTCGDTITLQHCVSMLHRLPPKDDEKPALNELQPNINPLEVLFDVQKLIDENNDQPLSASWVKVVQTIALHDYWVESRNATPAGAYQWAQHAVQAILWSASGCESLANIEEHLVMALSVNGGNDNNRITTILNHAYRKARQGEYDQALVTLLEPDVWRGLEMSDYSAWAQEVWHVLALRATRRDQEQAFYEFLMPRRPPGDYSMRHYSFKGIPSPIPGEKMSNDLFDLLHMKSSNQAATAVDQLLRCLWQSEFLGRIGFYRIAIVFLADVGLEFGLSNRCQRIIEEIMPQIILGGDVELRAVASFTLARCILVAKKTHSYLQDALHYMAIAEMDFLKLEMFRQVQDVQYFQAVIYENLDLTELRDQAAKKHKDTEVTLQKYRAVVVDPQWEDVLQLVAHVGGYLASRR